MTKTVLTAFFAILLTMTFAQDWQTDFNTAKQMAADGNKKIILVFQGSDWCAPCIKLDREIWSTDEFKSLAKDRFVMLKADFPRKKGNRLSPEQQEHNNQLAEQYNPDGYFPFVAVLDSEGRLLGTAGYEKTTPQGYFEKLASLQ
jgi:thioredoxin-related protein